MKPYYKDDGLIIIPALGRLYGKSITFPELTFTGTDTSDAQLLAWADKLRNAYYNCCKRWLLNRAIRYLAYYSKQPVLRDSSQRLFELLGGDSDISESG